MFNDEWLVLEESEGEGTVGCGATNNSEILKAGFITVLIFSMNQTFFPYSYNKSTIFKKILVDDKCHLLYSLLLILISVGKARDHLDLLAAYFLLPRLVICCSHV